MCKKFIHTNMSLKVLSQPGHGRLKGWARATGLVWVCWRHLNSHLKDSSSADWWRVQAFKLVGVRHDIITGPKMQTNKRGLLLTESRKQSLEQDKLANRHEGTGKNNQRLHEPGHVHHIRTSPGSDCHRISMTWHLYFVSVKFIKAWYSSLLYVFSV